MENARRCQPNLLYTSDPGEACVGAHTVAVLTEWQEFRGMDPWALGCVVNRKAIVDGRNILDPYEWQCAGWTYTALGRPRT
jgi:UDPglucose 6-dehydrogenase